MYSLLWVTLLVSMLARAQDSGDGPALLRKVESVAGTTKNWRADVLKRSQISGRGINLQDEVHIKIAAQAPLKVRRENSGGDQTVWFATEPRVSTQVTTTAITGLQPKRTRIATSR
jgi:hypothetical protein